MDSEKIQRALERLCHLQRELNGLADHVDQVRDLVDDAIRVATNVLEISDPMLREEVAVIVVREFQRSSVDRVSLKWQNEEEAEVQLGSVPPFNLTGKQAKLLEALIEGVDRPGVDPWKDVESLRRVLGFQRGMNGIRNTRNVIWNLRKSLEDRGLSRDLIATGDASYRFVLRSRSLESPGFRAEGGQDDATGATPRTDDDDDAACVLAGHV
ncbi:MAG: hypothetical protein KDC38_05425 [Planctomycetes bacterium]|nr:hypothetical protein [Planctomycetota bacterium]